MLRRTAVALAGLLAAGGCTPPPARLSVEPGVTFAAHRDGDRFVIDRLRAGGSGVLTPPGRFRPPNAANFLLRIDDETRAALWVIGRSRVLAREEDSTIAPRRGEVLSEWEAGAIRLTLFGRDGSSLRTDAFVRADGRTLARGAAPGAGAYRAAVRDAGGADVGWMRLETSARSYDGVLPAGVDDVLAAAAAVALDGEVEWIADHAAVRE